LRAGRRRSSRWLALSGDSDGSGAPAGSCRTESELANAGRSVRGWARTPRSTVRPPKPRPARAGCSTQRRRLAQRRARCPAGSRWPHCAAAARSLWLAAENLFGLRRALGARLWPDVFRASNACGAVGKGSPSGGGGSPQSFVRDGYGVHPALPGTRPLQTIAGVVGSARGRGIVCPSRWPGSFRPTKPGALRRRSCNVAPARTSACPTTVCLVGSEAARPFRRGSAQKLKRSCHFSGALTRNAPWLEKVPQGQPSRSRPEIAAQPCWVAGLSVAARCNCRTASSGWPIRQVIRRARSLPPLLLVDEPGRLCRSIGRSESSALIR